MECIYMTMVLILVNPPSLLPWHLTFIDYLSDLLLIDSQTILQSNSTWQPLLNSNNQSPDDWWNSYRILFLSQWTQLRIYFINYYLKASATTPLPADVDYKIVLLKFLLYLLSQRPPSGNDLALKCKMSPRYNKYSPQSTSINTWPINNIGEITVNMRCGELNNFLTETLMLYVMSDKGLLYCTGL